MYKEKRKLGLPHKSAFETTDDPYNKDVPILTLGQDGTPGNKILVERGYKDLQAHWKMHEKTLWLVILFSAIYFLFVIITYG